MKTGFVLTALVLLSSLAGSAATAVARAAHFAEIQKEAGLAPVSEEEAALLDVSEEDKAATQHRALLVQLQKREREADQAKYALQAEQQSLMTAHQVQQLLETRLTTLEASEDASDSDDGSPIAVQNGAVKTVAHDSVGDAKDKNTVDEESHSIMPEVTQALKSEAIMMASGVPAASVVLIPGTVHATSINVTQTEQQYWDDQNRGFIATVSSITGYLLATLIAALLYVHVLDKSAGPKLPEAVVRVDEFQFGAFECGDVKTDWQICLCSWCCEWVRWSDTASHPQVDFLGFWPALLITTLLCAISSITYGATIPILLLIVVLCRQRIRLAYGLPSGTFAVLAWDCCLWMWCPCCAIVQEARQVDYVESRLVKDSMNSFSDAFLASQV